MGVLPASMGKEEAIIALRRKRVDIGDEKRVIPAGEVHRTPHSKRTRGIDGTGGGISEDIATGHVQHIGDLLPLDRTMSGISRSASSKKQHKDRHAKRRLTSDRFLAVYDQILDREGVIEFKTDNQELFRFSLESIPQAGWKILEKTFDLHHSDMAQGNVMTEYEEKFSAEGKPICKLTARR